MRRNRSLKLVLILLSFAALFFCCRKSAKEVHYPLKKVIISEGDTLSQALDTLELPSKAQKEIIQNLNTLFNPKYSKPGDSFEIAIDTSLNPTWKSFSYYPSGEEYYSLKSSTSGIIETKKFTRSQRKEKGSAAGAINSTLWEAMSSKHIDPELIMDFADIFASHIDFLTEPRQGDKFKIIYEKTILDNGKIIHRQILGAQYIAQEKDLTAILFAHPDGTKGYYSPDGKSLQSAFLRAPLQYRRISSYFTTRRYHPIFKIFRPHLGIDYAAPQGTPVSSIGNGTVIFAGWKGGNGNFIEIRHPNGFVSYYGHLSRIAKGIRPGAKVARGSVIGNVGMTGIATGPHLDFRVKKNGSFINYLKLKIPSITKIKKTEEADFKILKQETYRQLAELNYK